MGSEWVEVAGARLFVQTRGHGQPVLLINGIGASHAMWEPMMAGLVGVEVISFDAPGVGRSSATRLPLSIAGLGRMTRELLERLDRPRVDVVGYSFGGAIAQELARQYPDAVRRLVLAGATCGWGAVPGTPGSMAILSMPFRYYSRLFYLATAALLAGGQAERDPEFVQRAGEARLRHPPSIAGYLAQLMALSYWSSLPWLHGLKQPTLVVQGEEDPVVPHANGTLLARRIPNARLRLQQREGHFLLLDPRSSAIPAIAEFLRAKDHRTSTTWLDSVDVQDVDVAAAIKGVPDSAQPFAAISALLRATVPPRRPRLAR